MISKSAQHGDLRTWLAGCDAALWRPPETLCVRHEITALQHALDRRGDYPPILVDRPTLQNGEVSRLPVATNLLASRALAAGAMGIDDHRHAGPGLAAKARHPVPPTLVSDAPVRQRVFEGDDVDLETLPALVQHGLDPGPYLTAAHATTVDPDSGVDNTAIQRCWIKGPRRMSWFPYPASHNMQNLRKYWAAGQACPVVFWIGHHPAVMMGAQAKLTYPESHWSQAGAIAGAPLRLIETGVDGVTIRAPADAEILIEGMAPPGGLEADGPFGEYTGYAGPQVAAPVVEVTRIAMRDGAIYHDIGSGLADALVPDNLMNEGKVFSTVKQVAPALRNVHIPVSGRRFHAYLHLHRPAPGETRAALEAAIADRRIKAAFAFDSDIDLFAPESVLWAIATRVQWHRDSWIVEDRPGSLLDPSFGPGASTTSKMAVDATLPSGPARDAPQPAPPVLEVPAEAAARARALLAGFDAAGGTER